MKALTLRQPWAALVAIGAKTIETRSWRTHYRGPLAIHAGAAWGTPEQSAYEHGDIRAALYDNPVFMHFGCVIAIAQLVSVELITEHNIPPEPERSFGDYHPGHYAWHLADVRRLGPAISAKGHLGLWEWDTPLMYRCYVQSEIENRQSAPQTV